MVIISLEDEKEIREFWIDDKVDLKISGSLPHMIQALIVSFSKDIQLDLVCWRFFGNVSKWCTIMDIPLSFLISDDVARILDYCMLTVSHLAKRCCPLKTITHITISQDTIEFLYQLIRYKSNESEYNQIKLMSTDCKCDKDDCSYEGEYSIQEFESQDEREEEEEEIQDSNQEEEEHHNSSQYDEEEEEDDDDDESHNSNQYEREYQSRGRDSSQYEDERKDEMSMLENINKYELAKRVLESIQYMECVATGDYVDDGYFLYIASHLPNLRSFTFDPDNIERSLEKKTLAFLSRDTEYLKRNDQYEEEYINGIPASLEEIYLYRDASDLGIQWIFKILKCHSKTIRNFSCYVPRDYDNDSSESFWKSFISSIRSLNLHHAKDMVYQFGDGPEKSLIYDHNIKELLNTTRSKIIFSIRVKGFQRI
ncbi:hypothetical protein DFA_04104 [Cavenderia fasciculata]|uniref:Uncharacterized protein n=1 Tax=Cavenderia fasciculata TaxID=261658 RepID=F4Q1A9_CACFS|nr:uncharacterized protein DFA_04104 [Cavenderia fasciculata]EGG18610.1 hypothetical protein DFA_04104 [Cavenderia fasciculata]|eukprot:XP_004366514.1 hypothetical protein DFA_04104 [Cavenderia fasciculata]